VTIDGFGLVIGFFERLLLETANSYNALFGFHTTNHTIQSVLYLIPSSLVYPFPGNGFLHSLIIT
jgi:hypothetical protein